MNPVINPINRKTGFTLVELLTVISIILILAALLFPTVNRMRDGAATAGCASNIRQCMAMSLLFAAEQDGRLPKLYVGNPSLPGEVGKTPLPVGEKIVNNGAVSWWPDLITTYGEGGSMVSCPKLKQNATKGPGGGASNRVPLGIGINYPAMASCMSTRSPTVLPGGASPIFRIRAAWSGSPMRTDSHLEIGRTARTSQATAHVIS